jgi:acyl-CoA thioesterase I
MKILYIIAIILGCYILFAVVKFKYTLATAHVPVFAQTDQTLGAGPALKYVAAGDSTAAGEGASKLETAYAYQVALALTAHHQVEYKNVAVRGARTNDVINDQLSKIIAANPDVITLSIGANDFTHLANPTKTLANFKTILDALTQQTHAQIYVTDIPIVDQVTLLPYPYRKFLGYRIAKINPQIKSLETDRVHVVDIHEFGWDQFGSVKETFAADGFHPNDVGYANWAAAFADKMKGQF